MSSQQQITSSLEQQRNSELSSKTDSIARSTQIDSRRDVLSNEIINEQSSNEDVLTTIREYDTDKPIDVNTGKPPLKKETTQERQKVDTATQKQKSKQDSDEQSEKIDDVRKQTDDKTLCGEKSTAKVKSDTHIEVDEERGLSTFQQILCGIGLLAIIATLIWLGWKLRRRFFNH